MIFLILFYVFLGSKLGPGTSWTLDLHFNKLSKIPLSNATYQISNIRQEEDILSMHIYGSNLGPFCAGPSWTLGPWFEQIWLRTTRQCYVSNFKDMSQAVLEKNICRYISLLNRSPPPPPPPPPPPQFEKKLLERGVLGKATYQISRPYAWRFKKRCRLKQIVHDARKTLHDGRQTLVDVNSI